MTKIKYFTKLRFVNGLACSKLLWLYFNKPEEMPQDTEGMVRILEKLEGLIK